MNVNVTLEALTLSDAERAKADALIVLLPADFKAGRDALSRWVRPALEADELLGKDAMLVGYRVDGVSAARVVVAGLGDGSTGAQRKAVQSAIAQVKNASVKRLLICFAGPCDAAALTVLMQVVGDASYVYRETRSKSDASRLEDVLIAVPALDAALQAAFDCALGVAKGVATAREWANRPANHATPTLLANAARALAKGSAMACEVLGPKEVAKLGMGAFEAVARGSHEELRFIELSYSGAAKSEPPIVLVGKGITFDTGGISIKPAAEMDEMKFDMSGAASVLGVFRALRELKPRINVVGLIPACENMPDGRAVKPGDVVTSMSGQTIEILNTDAEGRLVLCDALTYAERFKPSAIVDIATLTGACVIALGGVRSGMFANDDDLAQALLAAGDTAHDLCWRMPLDAAYAEGLKTNFADVANVAGRPGGAITAAKFLQRFVEGQRWAHLDIAGTAWKGGAAKGATGRPVGLLVHYLLGLADGAPAAKPPKAKRRKG